MLRQLFPSAAHKTSIFRRLLIAFILLTVFVLLLLSIVTYSVAYALLAQSELMQLVRSYAYVGLLCMVLSILIASLLSYQLTGPIRMLTERVQKLRPGQWQLSRSVHSGDEVEVLDCVITDLALRLRGVYQHQEEEIHDRTADLTKQYTLDRAILDSIEQGVITIDKSGVIIDVNPAAIRMLQLPQAEVTGQSADTVVDVRLHSGSKENAPKPLQQCLATQREVRSPANAHWSIMRKDGTMLPVIMAVSPLVEKNTIFGAIVVLQDITEERRLDYLKSEFITLASHQLRTPLSAIRWYVELLDEEQSTMTESQQSYVAEIDIGLKRMIALLTSLLNASHLEGENLKPDIKLIDVSALLEDLTHDCKSLASQSGLLCTFDSPRDKVMMETDETLLRIVLQNLITNAVKYSGPDKNKNNKGIEVRIETTGENIVFVVKDQGVGIPLSEQSRIFQRFFRAKNVRKMDTDGNGLGLAISKSIVESLGGTITFESKENEGTTFRVSFPLKAKQK